LPRPAGLLHGFLAERWHGEAAPLDMRTFPRDRLVAHLCRYLAFRARAFPAGLGDGATLDALLAMAEHNVGESLGSAAAAPLAAWRPRLGTLARRQRRVAVDGRLHAHEWLVAPDGRLLKTDAVDHAQAHDLVGCQDVLWDVAGAGVEFDLDGEETAALAEAVVREGGTSGDSDLLAFLRLAYAAFQLGRHTLGSLSAGPEERGRLEGEVARYRDRLTALLG